MASKKRFGALVKAGFEEKIHVRAKGRRKRVDRLEVIVFQQVMQAVRGEKQALRFVLKHLAEMPETDMRPKRLEEWHTDGSKHIFYRSGKIKCVAADGTVIWYKDRDEYHARRRLKRGF